MVAVLVGSPSDRRRYFFLGLLCIVGFLYGVPRIAANLALSAWETDLIQVLVAGGACFFILRGMRATGASGQTEVPVPAGGRRTPYLTAGAALAVVGFVAVLLLGKRG